MGNLFGFLHKKEKTAGLYYDASNGWWTLPEIAIYIPTNPQFGLDQNAMLRKRDAIAAGMRRWQTILKHPDIQIGLKFVTDPALANIIVSFSQDKPRDPHDPNREVWAVTTTYMDLTPPVNANHIHHAEALYWIGLSDKDQVKSSTHESGHKWGLNRHSLGGLMSPNIDDDYPGTHDRDTLLIGYRQRNEQGLKPK